ncbi:MAG TPA: AI-2E family transporter [Candidatus Atribacteria bacterium]|nr:AI-2E family transporter [Candidatus Atribacteria bacterium]HPT79327.1 AI-2E family transporter [Candidatus Atribacteria bacterium]
MTKTRKYAAIAILLAVPLLALLLVIIYWSEVVRLFRIVVIAIVFAYVLTPLCDLLERRMPRTAAVVLIFLFLALVLAGLFVFVIPSFVNEVKVIYERLPLLFDNVRKFLLKAQMSLERLNIPDGIREPIFEYTNTIQTRAMDWLRGVMDKVVGSVAGLPSLLISPVLGFYFLKDREYFSKVLAGFVPIKSRRMVSQIAAEINRILHRFIRGEAFVAVVVFGLATLTYLIIGLPYALVLGFLAGIFEFIPYFGPWLGAVPAIAIAYAGGTGKLIWTLVAVILIQQLEGAFITPRILGGVVELHPVYIILALWAGGLVFGVAGMFFAVPLLLILKVIIRHLYLAIVSVK